MRMLQHEVRTPLGHVIGYSEMLEEEVLDRGQEDLVEDLVRIRKAASRLLDLVDGKLRTDPTEEIARLAEHEPDAEEPEAALADTASDAAPVGRGRVLIVDADVDGRGSWGVVSPTRALVSRRRATESTPFEGSRRAPATWSSSTSCCRR